MLGTIFSFDRLSDLSSATEGEIGTALRDLKAAHFILEVHGVTDARYNFVHALTHEVAYKGFHCACDSNFMQGLSNAFDRPAQPQHR